MSQKAKTPEQLLADIDSARLEISTTLDQLQQQSSPEALRARFQKASLRAVDRLGNTVVRKVDEMTDNVGEKITQKGNDLVEVIREHPLPATLIGIGVGLLIAASIKAGQRRTRQNSGNPLATAREKAAETKRDVEDATTEFDEQADHLRGAHTEEVRGSRRRGNPLAVGGAAATLGIAIGLLIPISRYENGTLGRVRDKLITRAKEGVQGVAAAAKDTVSTTIQRAKEEADRRGSTSEEVRESTEGKIESSEAVEEAKATAREGREEQDWSN